MNNKNKFNRFSVSLGLLDYVNPILYTITSLLIINNTNKLMIVPWNILYIIGAIISIIGGLCIPTIKVLIGLNKIKFKLPVAFVFLVNTGIFISGLTLFKSILNINFYLILLIIFMSIIFLYIIYRKTNKFNNIAVLIGFIGYLLIYISLLILTIKNSLILPTILYFFAIILFLILIIIGLKCNLKNAKIHWIIESTNIICQSLVAISTYLVMISI